MATVHARGGRPRTQIRALAHLCLALPTSPPTPTNEPVRGGDADWVIVTPMDVGAALYAAVHTGTAGDRGFYSDVCEGASNVLELGCGGGRLLPVLATGGRRVVGLDHDPALLALARAQIAERGLAEHAELVHADMRTFSLPERFDRVVLAFNGLWCLPGPQAMKQALRRAAAHLAPGGILALDVYRTDAFHADAEPEDLPDDALHPVATVTAVGSHWDVRERSTWDRARRRIEATYLHEALDGRRHTATIVHHYLLESELVALVRSCGLPKVQTHYGLAMDESLLIKAQL